MSTIYSTNFGLEFNINLNSFLSNILGVAGESLHIAYLTPYLESLRPNFTNGANFAIHGSSTLPRLFPLSLDVQVLQFLRFRDRFLLLISKGTYVYLYIYYQKTILYISGNFL